MRLGLRVNKSLFTDKGLSKLLSETENGKAVKKNIFHVAKNKDGKLGLFITRIFAEKQQDIPVDKFSGWRECWENILELEKSFGGSIAGWDEIEKSFKYVRRWMGNNGKWRYLYPEDMAKPLAALKRLFGIADKRVSDDYAKHNIKGEFGADKKTFAAHVLEYLTNRFKWDKIFSARENREKYKKPVKRNEAAAATVEKIGDDGQPGLFKEGADKTPGDKKDKGREQETNIINRSLMRRIWGIYNPEKEKTAESGAEAHKNRSDAMMGNDNARKDGGSTGDAGDNAGGDSGGGGPGDNDEDRNSLPKLNDNIHTILNGTKADKEKLTGKFFHLADTPQFMKQYGLTGDFFEVKYGVITRHSGKDAAHNLTEQNWLDISQEITKPFAISKHGDGYRLFVNAKIGEKYIAAGIDVKLIGKGIEVNTVTTAFGYERNAENEAILYRGKNLTPDQAVLLDGLNSLSLPPDQALPTVSPRPGGKSSDPAEIKRIAEEAGEKEARKEAGMPQTGLFDRSSALEDSTWDPKSKDYRYQDTGYIAGSRKEIAANSIRRMAKEGTHINEKDIDWQGIEENPRQAKQLITKSNIFGKVDWDALREGGMTGGAGFLADRVYASVGGEPGEDAADARHNYSIAIDGLRDRLEKCKTVTEVTEVIREIRDEMNGDFVAAREAPEVKELSDKLKTLNNRMFELKREEESIMDWRKKTELDKKAEAFFEAEAEKIRAKDKRKKRISSYDLPEEARKKYNEMTEEARQDRMKQRDEFRRKNGYLDDEKLTGPPTPGWPSGEYLGFKSRGYFYEEIKELEEKRKNLYTHKATEIVLSNPLHLAWTQLGDKFEGILHYGSRRGSDAFHNHVSEARRGKYDDWGWAKKEKADADRKGQKRRIEFELKVASKTSRKGGRDVKPQSTLELKNNFNLRDVQSGNWVLNDPESAKFHVENIAMGFSDLSDMTGIPDNLLSMNGRLAMAIGARGTGNAGWKGAATANYEPVERVINLTKMKGGGSLAHEWFHAFDNLISESMTGGNISQFLTEPGSGLSSKQRKLKEKAEQLRGEAEKYGSYQRVLYERAKKEAEGAGVTFPEPGTEEDHIQRVKAAFDNLVKAMTTGDVPLKSWIYYTEDDCQKAKYNFEHNTSSFSRSIRDAGSLDRAMEIVNDRFGGNPRNAKDKKQWMIITAAYYDKKPLGGMVYAKNGKMGTSFKSRAVDLDGGRSKDYWSSTKEMAARAFAGYVDDKLRESGRLNDYLAYATTNDFYADSVWGPSYPYPEGEERKRINAAFDQVFQAVNDSGAIRKALEAGNLTGWDVEVHKSHIRKLDKELDAILEDDDAEGEETGKEKDEILEPPTGSGQTKKSFVFSNGKIWVKTA